MDAGLLYTILAILTVSVALNLKLTFSLMHVLGRLALPELGENELEVGELVPEFKGKFLASGEKVIFDQNSQASVLLFLASKCPKCRQKLPEIQRMLPILEDTGLRTWLISNEPKWPLKRFLGMTPLFARTVLVNKKDYKILNTKLSSPYYLLIDQSGSLQASGLIGDENWLSFQSQMDELAAEAAA